MMDIVEFAHLSMGPAYQLYPMQKAILKACYGRTEGNEALGLDAGEIKALERFDNKDAIRKLIHYEGGRLRERSLVLGRRSGKDVLSTLVALYEVYWLLTATKGCPRKYYNIDSENPIYIVMISASVDQSRILFNEVKSRISQSPISNWVSDIDQRRQMIHFGKSDTEADTILWVTHKDSERLFGKSGTDPQDCISFTHKDSERLLGKRYFGIFLCEAGSFPETIGSRILASLAPSTADFVHTYCADSTINIITTVPSEAGHFVEKFHRDASRYKHRIAIRLPTWEINPNTTRSILRKEYNSMSDKEFGLEFGCDFVEPEVEPVPLTIRLTQTTIDRLKQMARRKSFEQDSDISYVELIREAVDQYLRNSPS